MQPKKKRTQKCTDLLLCNGKKIIKISLEKLQKVFLFLGFTIQSSFIKYLQQKNTKNKNQDFLELNARDYPKSICSFCLVFCLKGNNFDVGSLNGFLFSFVDDDFSFVDVQQNFFVFLFNDFFFSLETYESNMTWLFGGFFPS